MVLLLLIVGIVVGVGVGVGVVVVVVVVVVFGPLSISCCVCVFTCIVSESKIYFLCLKVAFIQDFVRKIGKLMHFVIFDCGCDLQYLMQQLRMNGVTKRTIPVHVNIGIIIPGEIA